MKTLQAYFFSDLGTWIKEEEVLEYLKSIPEGVSLTLQKAPLVELQENGKVVIGGKKFFLKITTQGIDTLAQLFSFDENNQQVLFGDTEFAPDCQDEECWMSEPEIALHIFFHNHQHGTRT